MKRLPPLSAIEAFVQAARTGLGQGRRGIARSVLAGADPPHPGAGAPCRPCPVRSAPPGDPAQRRRRAAARRGRAGARRARPRHRARDRQGRADAPQAVGAAALRLLSADAAAAEAAGEPSRSAYRHRDPAARARPARRRARRGDHAGARGRCRRSMRAGSAPNRVVAIGARHLAEGPHALTRPEQLAETTVLLHRDLPDAFDYWREAVGVPACRAGGDRPFRFGPADPRRRGRGPRHRLHVRDASPGRARSPAGQAVRRRGRQRLMPIGSPAGARP